MRKTGSTGSCWKPETGNRQEYGEWRAGCFLSNGRVGKRLKCVKNNETERPKTGDRCKLGFIGGWVCVLLLLLCQTEYCTKFVFRGRGRRFRGWNFGSLILVATYTLGTASLYGAHSATNGMERMCFMGLTAVWCDATDHVNVVA
ncbi:hypothetical protein GE09DRAFT_1072594 [Coniochaeta sp. 2T2.1]|nr:hypothetical protein GE09DRAFT_1072594 [Coniochaeta sp. 2T2.1]